jgi:hypothetical protein
LDTTAPLITVLSHKNGDTTTEPTLTLTGIIVDEYLSTLFINGHTGTFTKISPTIHQRTFSLSLKEGTNAISLQAIDEAGNKSEI